MSLEGHQAMADIPLTMTDDAGAYNTTGVMVPGEGMWVEQMPQNSATAASSGPPPFVQRMRDNERLKSNPYYAAVKHTIAQHCFPQDTVDLSVRATPTRDDVLAVLDAMHAPTTLTSDQKQRLRQVMENMEKWWSESYRTLQGINEESIRVMALGATKVPPVPLPLRLQYRMKLMVLAIEELLKKPEMPMRGPAPHILPLSPNTNEYWRVLAKQYESNPRQVLYEWLLQHFDKPYPNDQQKRMLADATGMSRTQVSNWFINARVRTWRPMVMQLGRELSSPNAQEGRRSAPKYLRNQGRRK